MAYRCKSNKMLLLYLILPFFPKLHKISMSRVLNHAKKDLGKILEPYLKYLWIYLDKMFFGFFEMSAFDEELMTVSLALCTVSYSLGFAIW